MLRYQKKKTTRVRTDEMLTADSSSNALLVLLSHTIKIVLIHMSRMYVNGEDIKTENNIRYVGAYGWSIGNTQRKIK